MGSGGGQSTTTSYDEEYNKGLLELAEKSDARSEMLFNQFMYGVDYNPNEKVTGYMKDGEFVENQNPNQPQQEDTGGEQSSGPRVNAQGRTHSEQQLYDEGRYGVGSGTGYTPSGFGWEVSTSQPNSQNGTPATGFEPITKTRGELNAYDPTAQTSERDYMQNRINMNQSLLADETELRGNALGLGKTFLKDIDKGVNIGQRQDQAQAEVQHGFKLAERENMHNLRSYGLSPSDPRYAAMNRGTAIERAKGIAGARTAAKVQGEAEDFERKAKGLTLASQAL